MRGFWTFVLKEIARFSSVPVQTVLTPLMSSFLYILIFGLALGRRLDFPYEISYLAYITSGLVIMNVFLHAFQNATTSIIIAKYRMNIVDVITYPIPRSAVVLAYGIGGVVRGLVVGGALWVLSMAFVPPLVHSPVLFLLSAGLGGLVFAFLGTWLGLLCTTFEQVSIYTNFVITPILFLSGVFFPTTLLPEPWRWMSSLNPLVYVVETVRHGLTGVEYDHLYAAFLVVPWVVGFLWWGATRQMKKGVKTRS